jgi:hypothetical protein
MTMTNNTHYADTAYDSTRPRDLPPVPEGLELDALSRQRRRHPLVRGVHCGELLALSNVDHIEVLQDENHPDRSYFEEPGEESYQVYGLQNPKVVVGVLTKVAAFFALGGGVTAIITALLRTDLIASEAWMTLIAIVFVIPTSIYMLGKLALHYNLISDKNNTSYNRRTGYVTREWKRGPMHVRFDECDGYVFTGVPSPSGVIHHNLSIAHRYSAAEDVAAGSLYSHWRAALWWEFFQQYMDISKPLPDIPEMEPYRTRDPVTAEYDQRTGRDPNYWAKMPLEEARRRQDAAGKAAANYPWGETREQALASGWRPSSEVLEEQTRVEDTRNDFEAVLAGLTGVLSGHPPVAQARWQSDLDTKSGALRYRINLLPAHDIIGGSNGLDQAKKAVREALPPEVQSMVEIRIDETPDGELFYRRAS